MILQSIILLLFLYLICIGGTYNGIVLPQVRLVTMMMLTITVLIWFLWRTIRKWRWAKTPIDSAILIALIAILLSTLTNHNSWRRSAIGIWEIGCYVGLWFLLYDILANRGIRRNRLPLFLLLPGGIVLSVGYLQMYNWIQAGGGVLVRPVSVYGNANIFATVLLLLIPLGFAVSRSARGLPALLSRLLAVLALPLLLLSFSRAAYLGLLGALLILIFEYRKPIIGIGRRLRPIVRTTLLTIMVSIVIVGVIWFVGSFTIGGRSVEFRTFIYDSALRLSAEAPIFGHGLFTFGRGLARLNSIPPVEPHAHAHNLFLQVTAELGLVGLVALMAMFLIIVHVLRRITFTPIVGGAVAALVGILIQHLFDFTALAPVVVIATLLTLIIPLQPEKPIFRGSLVVLPILGLWIVLLVTGFYDALNYQAYFNALSYGVSSKDYRGAADQMIPVIAADPAMPIYHEQQGLLYGLAAEMGDNEAGELAITAFERFIILEPYYIVGWANLAAVHAELGHTEQAYAAIQEAVRLAPDDYRLWYPYARMGEAVGEDMTGMYQQVLGASPNFTVLPDWNLSPQRRAAALTSPPPENWSQFNNLAAQGRLDEARTFITGDWSEWGLAFATFLTAVNTGAVEVATEQYHRLEVLSQTPTDYAYLYAAQVRLARLLNIPETAEVAKAQLVDSLRYTLPRGDWSAGSNIGYVQFLSSVIPQQFLAGVFYKVDPVLELLLAGS